MIHTIKYVCGVKQTEIEILVVIVTKYIEGAFPHTAFTSHHTTFMLLCL